MRSACCLVVNEMFSRPRCCSLQSLVLPATEEKGRTLAELTGELEQLDELYKNLYRTFQQWLREYNIHKLKRENLETKSKED